MSHISMFEEEVRQAAVCATPKLNPIGTVYDFYCKSARGNRQIIPLNISSGFGTTHFFKKSRRVSYLSDLVAAIEEDDNPDTIKELCGKPWKVYKASPLFNVQMEDPKYFERVSKLLSVSKYQVEISPIKGLRGTREDSTALRVQAFTSCKEVKISEPVAVIYMMAIEAKEMQLKSTVSLLPVVLASGLNSVLNPLMGGLQMAFDCVISRVHFPPEDLRWMFALWSGLCPGNKKISLKFKHPEIKKDLDSIGIVLKSEQVNEIWNRIRNKTETELTSSEVEIFYSGLYTHLRSVFGIRFDALTLDKISLPIFSASSWGQILIEDPVYFKTIVYYLTELCQGNLFSTNPRLGEEVDII